VMISLWDAQGLKATDAEGEEARRRIAETTDTGVTSRKLSVLRFADVSSPT